MRGCAQCSAVPSPAGGAVLVVGIILCAFVFPAFLRYRVGANGRTYPVDGPDSDR